MANPATIPTPVKDVQGDGRWMSMVSIPGRGTVPPCSTPFNLPWGVCCSVPVTLYLFSKGYSRGIVIGTTGRYLGGFKVCIMLFFGRNIWKALLGA